MNEERVVLRLDDSRTHGHIYGSVPAKTCDKCPYLAKKFTDHDHKTKPAGCWGQPTEDQPALVIGLREALKEDFPVTAACHPVVEEATGA